MGFNPDDAQQYLEGVEYPASKEELASSAESNGAPGELVERIQALSTPEFSSAALGRLRMRQPSSNFFFMK
jgi:hypothetical protein